MIKVLIAAILITGALILSCRRLSYSVLSILMYVEPFLLDTFVPQVY
jgi:hypothetical protein